MTAGYSGTPLAKKLGIVAHAHVVIVNEPDGFRPTLDPLPEGVTFRSALRGEADVVMLFVVERKDFERRIAAAENAIFPGGSIWVAWPKKASKVPTDMTEDVVRAVVLPRGLVDNKVCAIDEVWSGLRVVWRKENRGRLAR
jgi:hypothetical protein